MSEQTTQLDIHALIEARDFVMLKAAVKTMEIHDLTDMMGDLEEDDLAIVFRLLPQDQAAEIFGDLPIERQEYLLEALSSEKVSGILNDMPPDERTELLEELPGELAQRLLSTLRGEQLVIARRLLNYPEDSIGRLMTPEYVAVRQNWNVDQVFAHIRKVAPEKETLNVIYVVDEHWKLLDELTLEQIVLAEGDAQVAELMDEQVAYLLASEDQNSVVDEFKKYEAVALPVVNRQGVLVGIVTHDDAMDVAEEEDTEDFQKMVGMGALEYSYFGTGHLGMLRKRMPWLAILILIETVAVLILFKYQATLAVLGMFMPLINATAGNTGNQVAGLMIRGFAVQEIGPGDWKRVLVGELGRGLSLGAGLGVLAAAVVLAFDEPTTIAVAASAGMLIAVALANLLGAMLPFVFKRLGVDPAVTSGPFIASVMDVMSILIYFGIAASVLRMAG